MASPRVLSRLPQRILVPVDFMHGSHAALRDASRLARASGGSLCLLYVLPKAARNGKAPHDARWLARAKRALAAVLKRERLGAIARIETIAGPVARTVCSYAEREDFDLIVIGGRDRPDWHGATVGSTAREILRNSRVPVLLVPPRRPRKGDAS